jgi:hypothetical protein
MIYIDTSVALAHLLAEDLKPRHLRSGARPRGSVAGD